MCALRGWAQKVPKVTTEVLQTTLRNPDVSGIDVRLGGDRDSSALRINGAVTEDPVKPRWMRDRRSCIMNGE
jgi:hypothetical protein